MPDLIRHPESKNINILDSGFRRNDKSLRDNSKHASPEGEGFPLSPKGTLIIPRVLKKDPAFAPQGGASRRQADAS